MAQCFTRPGYGRKEVKSSNGAVTYTGELCAVGTFNFGAPAGSYMDKGTGKACTQGTYSTDLNKDPACTPCNEGVTTAFENSKRAADCALVLPGYYISAPQTASRCPLHTYKDTVTNATSCTPCPFDYRTRVQGATGQGDCLAPPGYELVPGFAFITECEPGFYKPDWNRNPCTKVGSRQQQAAADSSGYQLPDTGTNDCRVPVGYGITTLSPKPQAELCTAGNYGDDDTRPVSMASRCFSCGANLWTPDQIDDIPATSGFTSNQDCMVKPGFGITETTVDPCRVGYYNPGRNRNPCQPCPARFTTVDEMATSEEDCVVQPGWVKLDNETDPRPCDKGQDPVSDFFALGDESSWVRVAGASKDACFASCIANASCIQVRWSSFCEIHFEDTSGSREIGFRIGSLSLDYAFYRIKDGLVMGTQLGAIQTLAGKQACMDACKPVPECEAVVFESTSGSCTLVASDLVEGYVGRYHLVGSKLYTDSFITEP
eukprot:gene13894-14013_t